MNERDCNDPDLWSLFYESLDCMEYRIMPEMFWYIASEGRLWIVPGIG